MPRTRIKICGVTDAATVHAAATAGADAVGLVFIEGSPCFIEPDDAFHVMGALPAFVAAVGVFKDADVEVFSDVEEVCPTQFAQLHGGEDARTVRACGPDVIKTVRFDASTIEAELEKWSLIDEVCAVLIDAGAPGEDGFDWSRLAGRLDRCTKPIVLSGGLTPGNVAEAVRRVRPYAVSVSSGVERGRGVKDPTLIEAFCAAVRRADADLDGPRDRKA
ncbi:MAG TPA: phosphoribosylanthranilate isomerase [Phycisphaerales bacterium]|nr:phosphoribosylanthranilate isomerase [Phycisphaerales bacterium]